MVAAVPDLGPYGWMLQQGLADPSLAAAAGGSYAPLAAGPEMYQMSAAANPYLHLASMAPAVFRGAQTSRENLRASLARGGMSGSPAAARAEREIQEGQTGGLIDAMRQAQLGASEQAGRTFEARKGLISSELDRLMNLAGYRQGVRERVGMTSIQAQEAARQAHRERKRKSRGAAMGALGTLGGMGLAALFPPAGLAMAAGGAMSGAKGPTSPYGYSTPTVSTSMPGGGYGGRYYGYQGPPPG